MNRINWSAAPEGATHWEPERGEVNESWMKLEGGKWYYWGETRFNYGWVDAGQEAGDRASDMIERQAEWLGVGLPPAGVACEVTTNDGNNWRQTSILFSDDCMILLENYCLLRAADPDVYFRPIKGVSQDFSEHAQGSISKT